MAESMFDASNVGVGKGNPAGYAWCAPKGTELPTDAKTPLGAGFKGLGYTNEDGLVAATESDSNDIKDWSGTVIKKVQSGYAETYTVVFLESKADVLSVYYGSENVEDDGKGNITVAHNANFNEERAFVFETLITETLVRRTVIPRGSILEREDVEATSEDPLGYGVNITALPDDAGNTSYDYYYDSAKAAQAARVE